MRERLDSRHFYARCIRITPAYAGKTGNTCCDCKSTGDHPRVCGKDTMPAQGVHNAEGSPPRMRERLQKFIGKLSRLGITPAYAGKTVCKKPRGCEFKDHPRVCGKDLVYHVELERTIGSPPRMRERP